MQLQVVHRYGFWEQSGRDACGEVRGGGLTFVMLVRTSPEVPPTCRYGLFSSLLGRLNNSRSNSNLNVPRYILYS